MKISNALKYCILNLEYLLVLSLFLSLHSGLSRQQVPLTCEILKDHILQIVLPQLFSILALCGNVSMFIYVKAHVLLAEGDFFGIFSLSNVKYLL